jgi:hypothetical protein
VKTTITLVLYILIGWVSQYRPGLMSEVVVNRQAGKTIYDLPSPLPQGAIPIAWPYCREIGSLVELRIEGGPWMQAIIADCPHNDEVQSWMLDNSILCEIPGSLAYELGAVGKIAKAERRITVTREKDFSFLLEEKPQ